MVVVVVVEERGKVGRRQRKPWEVPRYYCMVYRLVIGSSRVVVAGKERVGRANARLAIWGWRRGYYVVLFPGQGGQGGSGWTLVASRKEAPTLETGPPLVSVQGSRSVQRCSGPAAVQQQR